MNNELILNCLYKKDLYKFKELKQQVKLFNFEYVGNNIIQNDIYSVLKNFVSKNNAHIEIFRLPINDDDFCAFTCVREGQLFMVVNSYLNISKQIFAMAHELYHIWHYMSNLDDLLPYEGSLLKSENLDIESINKEDREANAFAGLLLVPGYQLREQIEIYGIDEKNIGLKDVVRLMDVFAVPYKAILIRLLEEGLINEKQTQLMFDDSVCSQVKYMMEKENIALRWQESDRNIIDLSTLEFFINQNKANGFLPSIRIEEDEKTIHYIKETLIKRRIKK